MGRLLLRLGLAAWLPALPAACLAALPAAATPSVVWEVPADRPTIQAALDAAADGDVVRVAPGVYRENLVLPPRSVTLSAHEPAPGEAPWERTVIDGGGRTPLTVPRDVGPDTTVRGFTLRGGDDDGILAHGRFRLERSRATGNRDGIDYEGGGGEIRGCLFDGNHDDGIDVDGATALWVADTRVEGNGNDGIEIRFHPHSGAPLDLVLEGNRIVGNVSDGIQLIGGDATTSRRVRIRGNWIADNGRAGLGLLCCMRSTQDFQGAPLEEPVLVAGNSFVGNDHAVSGGARLVALNNLFVGNAVGLHRVRGRSVAAFNLFHANGTDHRDSHVDVFSTRYADPGLDAHGRPRPDGPAADAGTPVWLWEGIRVWYVPPDAYAGAAPDLGAEELAATQARFHWGR